MHCSQTTSESPLPPPYPGWCPQFSLASLLGLMFAASLWMSAMRTAPHWGIVMLAVFLTAGTSRLYVNLRRQTSGYALCFDDRLALASLATMAVMAWAFLYVASTGPAVSLAAHCRCVPCLARALATIYSPVVWLHDNTPLRVALDVYVNEWSAVL